MNKLIEIPEGILNTIKEKYKQGASIAKLQSEFNIPYHIIQSRLKNISINQIDMMSHNVGLLQRAENQMIGGVFPNYYFKLDLSTFEAIDKYKSLLHFFAKADLNNGYVKIEGSLLS